MCKYAHATLGAGNVARAVKLPDNEDEDEWLAMHVVDFYNETSLLYSTIMEKCTDDSCPKMNAGSKFEYLWADSKTKRPQKVSAPKYVDLLMTWIEEQLNDEEVFPTRIDCKFPSNFRQVVTKIMQRLFRVYAHIYHEHFKDILRLNAPAHLNSAFKRFVLFCKEFKLLQPRDTAPLQDLIDKKLLLSKMQEAEKAVKEKATPQYMLSAKMPIAAPSPRGPASAAVESNTTTTAAPARAPKKKPEEKGSMCLMM